MAKVVKGSIAEALNTSQFSLFHIKAMFASAMGFFIHANLIQSTAISFLIFVVFAVPGYFVAAATIDKIGHKFLQMLGFFMMGLMFFIIGLFPSIVNNFLFL